MSTDAVKFSLKFETFGSLDTPLSLRHQTLDHMKKNCHKQGFLQLNNRGCQHEAHLRIIYSESS